MDRNTLGMNRFKDRDPETFTPEEQTDYTFAKLLKKIIECLEASVNNERQFKRARFTIMGLIWDAYTAVKEQK